MQKFERIRQPILWFLIRVVRRRSLGIARLRGLFTIIPESNLIQIISRLSPPKMGDKTVPPDRGQDHKDRGGAVSDNAATNVQQNEDNNGKMSYSDRLKTNVRYDQHLKRNVLEITLEKTQVLNLMM